MKLYHIPQLIVFGFCLFLGRSIGSLIADAQSAPAEETRGYAYRLVAHPKPPVFYNQINFLIAQVDSLAQKHPELESLWWVLHKEKSSLNLIPLYPVLSTGLAGETVAQDRFSLLRSGKNFHLAPEFELYLHNQDIHWDGYLILDSLALSRLTGETLQAKGKNTDRLSLITNQWQKFCLSSLSLDWKTPSQIGWLEELDQHHLAFGPDPSSSLNVWQKIMLDMPQQRCSFPTLEFQGSH